MHLTIEATLNNVRLDGGTSMSLCSGVPLPKYIVKLSSLLYVKLNYVFSSLFKDLDY